MYIKDFILCVLLLNAVQIGSCDISLSEEDITVNLNEKQNVTLIVKDNTDFLGENLIIIPQHKDIVTVSPSTINLNETNEEYTLEIEATSPGHSLVNFNISNKSLEDVFLRVTVRRTASVEVISLTIGWIYFVAWSVSFYPQIYVNYKRKSVVGLNFDFLALNIVGFSLYGIFNLGLYFIPAIEEEYFNRYSRGLNPVQLNDIVFALHAAAASLVTIVQCFIYERDEQRVSITARIILGIFGLFLGISMIVTLCNVIHWLDFLYYCSYVKLTITLIKYVPQAYMNYKRKSTVGWSIGNIFLDFTGGILSMMQMILNSYNYDDWKSIFGDPTKFGLGLFSVVFDVFFIIQHYILYRDTTYELS